MFEEATLTRKGRSRHDYDEAELSLASIIVGTVPSEIVTALTNSVKADDEISRQTPESWNGSSGNYKEVRQQRKANVDEATLAVHRTLEGDEAAARLLNEFSRDPRAQLSAVREAAHLIIGGSVQNNNTSEFAGEMAGAK
jgi:hypothetical protein